MEMWAQENSIFALMKLAEFVCISHSDDSDERCIGHKVGRRGLFCKFFEFSFIEYFAIISLFVVLRASSDGNGG